MCSGGASFYGHFFACDKHHGMVDINNAIPLVLRHASTTRSRTGWASTPLPATPPRLGFSQKTGIDLPDEVSGTMPSTAWKMKNFHEKWYAGEVISVGIGQGAVTATPLQLARASQWHSLRRSSAPPARCLPGRSASRRAIRDSRDLPRLRRHDDSADTGELADHHRRHGQATHRTTRHRWRRAS